MKKLLLGFIVMGLIACDQKESYKMDIKVSGELRAIMHQGKVDATISTDTLNLKNLYGLGALDSLSGEVMILNGTVYQSSVINDSLILSADKPASACLLIYSHVLSWDTLAVGNNQDLNALLIEQAKELNLIEPFPFILTGTPASVGYHVVNFDAKTDDISNHKESAFNDQISNEMVSILGFYSTQSKGVYTHHDSDVHMHVIDVNRSIMGHVDNLDLGNGKFYLLMPKL